MKRNDYVVKGGANLRYFFDSHRYSEDIDFDALTEEAWKLQDQVDAVVASPAVLALLRSKAISIRQITKPEQTDTTQRWKVLLDAPEREKISTRIEFSRRNGDRRRLLEAVPSRVVATYGLRPPTMLHYTAAPATEQKVKALAQRSDTQARDIFDLELLFRTHPSAVEKGALEAKTLKDAMDRCLELPFEAFAAQVIPFLEPDVADLYGDPASWEQMQSLVVDTLMESTMRTADALGELHRLGQPVIETGEAVARLDVSPVRASQILRSLEDAGIVARLKHGLWLLEPDIDPFVIAPYLTAPFPAYVSLWSALSTHGMIEQIPRQVFVCSLGRARTVKTARASYAIHHLAAEVFGGHTGTSDSGYLATPEKALFDSVYLPLARRARVFLPEIELTTGFDTGELDAWTDRVRAPWLRSAVSRELDRLLPKDGH